MVDSEGGHACDNWTRYNVGRVERAAHANLENRRIDLEIMSSSLDWRRTYLLLQEHVERHHGEISEVSRLGRRVGVGRLVE